MSGIALLPVNNCQMESLFGYLPMTIILFKMKIRQMVVKRWKRLLPISSKMESTFSCGHSRRHFTASFMTRFFRLPSKRNKTCLTWKNSWIASSENFESSVYPFRVHSYCRAIRLELHWTFIVLCRFKRNLRQPRFIKKRKSKKMKLKFIACKM